jgi:hypothetical protein
MICKQDILGSYETYFPVNIPTCRRTYSEASAYCTFVIAVGLIYLTLMLNFPECIVLHILLLIGCTVI